jgi:hypothetical protein
MADEIVLTIPRERPFHGVAHLVLGGIGSRLELTFEALEDLQLALASLLEQDDGAGEITVTVRLADGAIETAVGPFDGTRLRNRLARADGVGLQRLLDTVADRFEVVDREDGTFVELSKELPARDGVGD